MSRHLAQVLRDRPLRPEMMTSKDTMEKRNYIRAIPYLSGGIGTSCNLRFPSCHLWRGGVVSSECPSGSCQVLHPVLLRNRITVRCRTRRDGQTECLHVQISIPAKDFASRGLLSEGPSGCDVARSAIPAELAMRGIHAMQKERKPDALSQPCWGHHRLHT